MYKTYTLYRVPVQDTGCTKECLCCVRCVSWEQCRSIHCAPGLNTIQALSDGFAVSKHVYTVCAGSDAGAADAVGRAAHCAAGLLACAEGQRRCQCNSCSKEHSGCWGDVLAARAAAWEVGVKAAGRPGGLPGGQ
eukprot:scaffold114882_cov22-Tisochrysis_lutea.AAC.1